MTWPTAEQAKELTGRVSKVDFFKKYAYPHKSNPFMANLFKKMFESIVCGNTLAVVKCSQAEWRSQSKQVDNLLKPLKYNVYSSSLSTSDQTIVVSW